MLGLHLRQHGVRWSTDGRFNYMMRRVPDHNETNLNTGPGKYTEMLSRYNYRTGRWVSRGKPPNEDDGVTEVKWIDEPSTERIAWYRRRGRTVEAQRWGTVEETAVPL